MALPAGSVLALDCSKRVMSNSARDFNGTNMRLNRTSPAAILRGQSGAIWRSLWVYVDADGASDTIVDCAGSSAGWRLYVDGSLNMVASFINTSSAAQNAQQTFSTAGWHHVAFGYDGTNVWISIDGAAHTTTAFSGTYAAETSNDFTIGARHGGTDFINAKICQVMGDDGDLTDAQYLSLFNGGIGYPPDQVDALLGASAPGFDYPLQEDGGAGVDRVGGLDLTDNNSVGSAEGVTNDIGADFVSTNSEALTNASDSALELTTDQAFTFGLRVRLDSVTGTQYIAGRENVYELTYTSGLFQIEVFTDAAAGSTVGTASSFGVASTNTDYDIIVWHDPTGNVIGISVNGTEDTTAHTGGTNDETIATEPLDFGRVGTNYEDLSIQDAWFAKSVLSSAQRAWLEGKPASDIYAASVRATGDGSAIYAALTELWPMREGSGTRAGIINGYDLTDVATVTTTTGFTPVARILTDVSAAGIDYQGANGCPVWRWEDVSGEDDHALQSTYSLQPKYDYNSGSPHIDFDGVEYFLTSGSISQPATVSIRVYDDEAGTYAYYLDGRGVSARLAIGRNLLAEAGNLDLYAGASAVSGTHTFGSEETVTGIFDGSSSDVRVDGSSLDTGNAGTQDATSGLTIGSRYSISDDLMGYIVRVAVSPSALSGSDLTDNEEWVEYGDAGAPGGGGSIPIFMHHYKQLMGAN